MERKVKLKQLFHKFLPSLGYGLENRTDAEKVKAIIKGLRPYAIGKDLIRLGPKEKDGGYLLPDDLEGIEACFSPGVGGISGFEEDCLSRGMKLFLADKSVDGPNLKGKDYNFIKKFVGASVDEDFITMDHWVNNSAVDDQSDLLLQMDIEGHEYASILSTSDALLQRFRIIIVEFHYIQRVWNQEFYNCAFATFNRLLQHHTCVHIHPNNCCGIYTRQGIAIPRAAEFTFIRNDRITDKKPQTQFPHPLDSDNMYHTSITLPKCWYEGF